VGQFSQFLADKRSKVGLFFGKIALSDKLLALYVALKQVNESYALIALILTLMAVLLVVQTRPLAELTLLT
jgi:hypothetical protein